MEADVAEIISIEDFDARRQALFARFGRPESFRDTAVALRLIGKRDEIHPDDAYAFLYQSRESAEAFAESNRRHGDAIPLGIMPLGDQWLGVIDLRPQLLPRQTHDPAAPDIPGRVAS
jgi:hypothetical protein